ATNGAGDRPAPDILAPLVGSKAALDAMAADALRNPDSPACAYTWVPATITTDGYRRVQEGWTLRVMYRGEMRPAVVWSAPRIDTAVNGFKQSFEVRILLD
ncbi:MAG: hypothetical protein D3910_17830, partial [Candidatus Electrothrix sp. ATG2]|nr:hypothetical protein [Candidatus Electrothrix sp. ATG2]